MQVIKCVSLIIIILSAILPSACQKTYQAEDGRTDLSKQKKLYYGIKVNNILCGYMEITQESAERDGRQLLKIDNNTFIMLSALGSKFNSNIHSELFVDSVSGQFVHQHNHIKQGPTDFTADASVKGDTVTVSSTLSKKTSKVFIDQQVLLRNNQFFPFLIKDFSDSSVHKKTYRCFEIRDSKIQEVVFKKLGEEKLDLAGSTFDALVFEENNQSNGLKVKWWIDRYNGWVLKLKHTRGESYLADEGVANRIKLSKMDDLILQKSNVSIADIQGISYMKIKARLEPSGLRITPQSLNVPGQKFTGTVKDNLIDGIFEIEHKRYNGENAPPFPPDFSKIDSVQEFIKASDLIESDDPVLVKKAKKLTAGAKDSWEAAVRLSQWVADSIGYAIPGGATARHTYDIRKGECGAHSILLAAFCRAVRIPSRMVWGCMYVPNMGGAFGQHGWTEIYMGEAGWIPVDATAMEADYVDSGHLRLGHFQSLSIALNPKKLEILDYRTGSESAESQAAGKEKYQAYLGKYKNGLELNTVIKDGCLTVDIPGKVVLALADEDENGYWFAKMSKNLFVEFSKNAQGNVTELVLHEIISLPRKTGFEAEALKNVPDEMEPFLGIYDFQQANAEFRVFFKNGSLAIYNPLERKDIKLQLPDERGRWKDEFNKNEFFFEKNSNGKVTAMKIDSHSRFERKN